ncbi:hypothetical protein [Nitrospira sp. Nam80]
MKTARLRPVWRVASVILFRIRWGEQDHGNVSFSGEGSSAEKDIVGLPGSQRAAEHIEKFAGRQVTEWALEYKCVIRGRNELVNRLWGLFLHDKTRLRRRVETIPNESKPAAAVISFARYPA